MKRIDKIKAWMGRNEENIIWTAGVICGIIDGCMIGSRIGQRKALLSFRKNDIPKIVNLSGFLGSYATYDWISKNVPEAKQMMDDFADKNPELSDISKLFYEYREIKELLS